jgi:AcrR family transcriptional regulator
MSPSPHQRRKTERPDELLEAALDLFVERGFAATRMEDVAQRAGVSKGTVYLYWPSKEDLLKAVIQRFLGTHLTAGAQAIEAHTGSTAELMHQVYASWWIEIIESPASGVFKLMLAEARNFPEIAIFYRQEVVVAGQALLASMLQRGIAAQEFRGVDVEAAVFSLMLPMVMLCVHKHSIGACAPIEGLQDIPRLVHGHVDLVLHGLLREHPAPSTSELP